MRSQTAAKICAVGVMVAAAIAWVVGSQPWSFSDTTYDAVVGGAGIIAALSAAVACLRRSWARIPLAFALASACLMAWARFAEQGDDGIDLTGLYLPPLILASGACALLVLSLGPVTTKQDQAPHR
ncbi:hypothetical protein [Aeromicrobium sp. UC242_57]|uniref:hypothetical protein n=1 Tax=Aeromicrobium sp. UC242_57 TaxID=3374624 RepID=UPI0037A398CB